MTSEDAVVEEIRRRQREAAHAFPDAAPADFAYNLVQEALWRGGPVPDRLTEVRTILDAVDGMQ